MVVISYNEAKIAQAFACFLLYSTGHQNSHTSLIIFIKKPLVEQQSLRSC
jgi:hypothetical protein